MKVQRFLKSLAFLVVFAVSFPVAARVISYAPVTNQLATPALQERTNRYFVLLESSAAFWGWGGGFGPMPADSVLPWLTRGRLVVYDSRGEEEPRAVLPAEGAEAAFSLVAARESKEGVLQILAVTTALVPGEDVSTGQPRLVLSVDGGSSWKPIAVPASYSIPVNSWPLWNGTEDFGGPFCRGRNPLVRTGNDDTPFVFTLSAMSAGGMGALAGVDTKGVLRVIAGLPAEGGTLIGTAGGGSSFLVAGRAMAMEGGFVATPPRGIYLVRLDSMVTLLVEAPQLPPLMEGWIYDDRGGHEGAFLEVDWAGAAPVAPLDSARAVYRVGGKSARIIVSAPAGVRDPATLRTSVFGVPTAGSYAGLWIIQRGPGNPTVLYFYSTAGASGLVEKWRDITAPEVEALHTSRSGARLLVQVHRPRPQIDQRIFKDPALAIWDVDTPAPRSYDELFLNEQRTKGFVHLDVDALVTGAPFVFDSGSPEALRIDGQAPGAGGTAGGGSEVSQEWGVVKGSLLQKLVIPSVARIPGVNNSFWKTDLLMRNPSNEALSVLLRFVPQSGAPKEERVDLSALEIKRIPDLLLTVFKLESGFGALFITPDGTRTVEATSRTYTASSEGTFGMGVGAIDVYAAASARFGLTFSGAFQGFDSRSNVGAVNVSNREARINLRAAGDSGEMGQRDFTFTVPAGGFQQVNGISDQLDFPSWRQGALEFRPESGEAIPILTVTDNRTNDPTYFPPDLSSSVVRIIPAVVHMDAANGAKYRSDLFLYNASDEVRSVLLAAKPWDSAESEKIITLTLLPHEQKTVRDALPVIFRMTGTARLRFQSLNATNDPGIRVTSRTYTPAANGGSYGLVIPPLNAFQTAGPGEALEILGVQGGASYRTNLALIETSQAATGGSVRVRVEIVGETGRVMDAFTMTVPAAGGVQLNDLFRSRGLGDGPDVALLRILPSSGLIGAFATTVDQKTNDPSYFPAGLAATEE